MAAEGVHKQRKGFVGEMFPGFLRVYAELTGKEHREARGADYEAELALFVWLA